MSGLVFWGCPSWAMVCWMNTRSVCRICQINFKSERIWAVNTQEIALLAWARSVIQEDGEQRRQEKEKACQGNWIICGIILSAMPFLFLLLHVLRLEQLECSIHVMEVWISVKHGWKALNTCHVALWALQISPTLRENAWRTRLVTVLVALQYCRKCTDSFLIWQPDELLILNLLPCLQTLSPSAHTTAMVTASVWLDPATAFLDSSGPTAPEVIIKSVWWCYSVHSP